MSSERASLGSATADPGAIGILAWVAAAALWYSAARIVLAIGKSPAGATATAGHAPLSSPVSSG